MGEGQGLSLVSQETDAIRDLLCSEQARRRRVTRERCEAACSQERSHVIVFIDAPKRYPIGYRPRIQVSQGCVVV